MKFFSSKWRIAAAAVLVVALFVIRPGASHLKSRIIHSISAGVGRPVDIGSVRIRLLPRPGFDLENLVVYDDPAFGAEPIVRASEVTAAIRLTSLLRGRLEIARLDLTEPSLNLVRREGGHWNLEALLERSARIPMAPTGKTKAELRPGFPYIEGTSGRINFKHGPEKRPYALTNADFSLWQESENTWGVRLKAQPFRTDMNLNDTGLLQVSGTWQRAGTLRDTPLQVDLEWSRAQLGQVSKLITGNDQGWRGDILLDLALRGTPAKLQISASTSVDDFRRYDITSGQALRLAMHCEGEYSSETTDFRQVTCDAPVGDGLITLSGNMSFSGHAYSIVMTAEKVPAAGLVALVRRAKKNLPDDLVAGGAVKGKLTIQKYSDSDSAQWQGSGEIADFQLSSASNRGNIGPETVPFSISDDKGVSLHRRAAGRRTTQPATEAHIEIGPVLVRATRSGGATIRGFMNRTAYDFGISGEAEIGNVLQLARMTGVPAPATSAEGLAQLDLHIAGNWILPGNGFAAPLVTGAAKLRNIQIGAHNSGLAAEIVSAEMQLAPDAVHILKLNAKAAGTSWTGSVDLPRGCGTPDSCPVRFVLNTKGVSLTDLNDWVNPSLKRPWYRVLTLNSDARPLWWKSLHASGSITADRLQVHGVEAMHVASNLVLEDDKLRFTGLTADVLGGKHRGEWKVDFAKAPATCTGTGSLNGISLAAVATAMDDRWVAGTANGNYEIKGSCPTSFWGTADGTLHVEVAQGLFPHVLIRDGTEPLQAGQLRGDLRLHSGRIEFSEAELVSSEGTYQLTGTASLKRNIDLKLTRGPSEPTNVGYSISGTLEAPRVTALSRTEQARLKSLPTK